MNQAGLLRSHPNDYVRQSAHHQPLSGVTSRKRLEIERDAATAAAEEVWRRSTPVLSEQQRSNIEKIKALCCPQLDLSEEDVESMSTNEQKNPMLSFLEWYDPLETLAEEEADRPYTYAKVAVLKLKLRCRDALKAIKQQAAQCDALSTLLDGMVEGYAHLKGHYVDVCEKTSDLKLDCEDILAEQAELEALEVQVDEKLEPFLELDRITRFFNSGPGYYTPVDYNLIREGGEDLSREVLPIVLHLEFIPTLQRIDECIAYMRHHTGYKDAAAYLARFEMCLTSGMQLIEMHFVNIVHYALSDLASRLAEMPADDAILLTQTKFRVMAPKLQPLLQQLEHRCDDQHSTYFTLLSDCTTSYLQARRRLLGPLITRHLQAIAREDAGSNRLQHAVLFVMEMLRGEWALFRVFFHGDGQDFARTMSTFRDQVYNMVLPWILHDADVERLSEYCHLLQSLSHSDKGMSCTAASSAHVGSLEIGQDDVTTANLVNSLLGDAQQRLLFRAQQLLQSGVASQPLTEEVLSHIAPPPVKEDVEGDSDTSILEEDMLPVIRHILDLLSKLEGCVSDSLYTDFAQEALLVCTTSLTTVFDEAIALNVRVSGMMHAI